MDGQKRSIEILGGQGVESHIKAARTCNPWSRPATLISIFMGASPFSGLVLVNNRMKEKRFFSATADFTLTIIPFPEVVTNSVDKNKIDKNMYVYVLVIQPVTDEALVRIAEVDRRLNVIDARGWFDSEIRDTWPQYTVATATHNPWLNTF